MHFTMARFWVTPIIYTLNSIALHLVVVKVIKCLYFTYLYFYSCLTTIESLFPKLTPIPLNELTQITRCFQRATLNSWDHASTNSWDHIFSNLFTQFLRIQFEFPIFKEIYESLFTMEPGLFMRCLLTKQGEGDCSSGSAGFVLISRQDVRFTLGY